MKWSNITEDDGRYDKDGPQGWWSKDPKVDELIHSKIMPKFDRALDLIFEWTKTGHINKRQFHELIKFVTKE